MYLLEFRRGKDKKKRKKRTVRNAALVGAGLGAAYTGSLLLNKDARKTVGIVVKDAYKNSRKEGIGRKASRRIAKASGAVGLAAPSIALSGVGATGASAYVGTKRLIRGPEEDSTKKRKKRRR